MFEEALLKESPTVLPLKERSDERVGVRSESGVVVPVSLNGAKANWMQVDSGAEVVLITKVAAEALGLKPIASAEYIGLGYKGTRKSGWVLLQSLKIGEFTLKNVPAMLMDKNTDLWKEMSGIIPLSLFKRHAVLFDRRHGKLALYPSGTKPEAVLPTGVFTVKSLWFHGKPFIEVAVKNAPKGFGLLDTGSTSTVVAAEMAPLTGVKANSGKYSGQYGIGLSGGISTGVADKVFLTFGTFRIEMPTALVDELGTFAEIDTQVLLGRDLLDNFLMFFDYPANVIAFKAYDK
jgi:predicted aspartyl protease